MASDQGFGTIQEYFGELDDPRLDRSKLHELPDIIAIAICGVVCGADNWVEIEDFGNAKYSWLKKFLSMPNGIPSHDTFGRVFSLLSPDKFAECFTKWVSAVSELTKGQVVAIDGKSVRRSHDKSKGKLPLHMVSAWASGNHLVLGQTQVSDHSNEITAIPELLNILELSGCIVTIDAMGCQKEIAEQIVDGGAEYVLAVKGNQSKLFDNIKDAFECAERDGFTDVDYTEQVNKDHGRLETRRCWVITDRDELAYVDEAREWKGLNSLAMVSYETDRGNKVESRYYISSLKATASKLLSAVRGHWGIENSLHWVLDMAFDEDHSRVRTGHADRNLAATRHMALNMLKQEKLPRSASRPRERELAGTRLIYLKSSLSIKMQSP